MKAVLISINPPHTNNIFDRIKGIEWRTKPMPTGKHYCYETKKCFGVGKVIGEFRIWRIHKYDNVSLIPEGYVDLGCVPLEFLEAYSKGRPLYAHFIVEPIRYDKPKEVSEFFKPCIKTEYPYCKDCEHGLNPEEAKAYREIYPRYFDVPCRNLILRPPQSWCYVEEVQ